MNIEELKNALPNYSKDIKINLGNILNVDDEHGLDKKQVFLIALSVAYTLKDNVLIQAISTDAENILDNIELDDAKSAACIMAMNNIYYRFTHLVSDKSFAMLPAKLRMTVIANPKVGKINFELMCLAVSAINGCGMCMDAHVTALAKENFSQLGIQTAIRIAAILNATALARSIAVN